MNWVVEETVPDTEDGQDEEEGKMAGLSTNLLRFHRRALHRIQQSQHGSTPSCNISLLLFLSFIWLLLLVECGDPAPEHDIEFEITAVRRHGV